MKMEKLGIVGGHIEKLRVPTSAARGLSVQENKLGKAIKDQAWKEIKTRIVPGQVMIDNSSNYTDAELEWIVPDHVTEVSVICIGPGGGGSGGKAWTDSASYAGGTGGGGGGLAYATLKVEPGDTLRLVAGKVGDRGSPGYDSGSSGSTSRVFLNEGALVHAASGTGGSSGYRGSGGSAGVTNLDIAVAKYSRSGENGSYGTKGTSGGSGGGGGYPGQYPGENKYSIGPYGPNGSIGYGRGGSGGSSGPDREFYGSDGQKSCVRVIWGSNRRYPDTNVQDM